MAKSIAELVVGDKVDRWLGGKGGVLMPLIVTEVKPTTVVCSLWEFSRLNGAEIDDDLGWGETYTGSVIEPSQL